MSEAAPASLKDDLMSLCDHDQRILVRAVVANKWSAFIPQLNQQWTKAAVRDKVGQILVHMATCVPTALEHKDPLDEANYKRVLGRVYKESSDRQRLSVYLIAENYRDKYGYGADGFDVYRQAVTLGQLMQSMEIEHQANLSGWLFTGIRVDPVKRAADEAHTRVGKRRVR